MCPLKMYSVFDFSAPSFDLWQIGIAYNVCERFAVVNYNQYSKTGIDNGKLSLLGVVLWACIFFRALFVQIV